MLTDIKTHLKTFETHAPHTIQRLAEMILHPRAHYKALASYLHAVDRVVRVTSGTDTYPLPPAIPDMAGMDLNGEDGKDPAASVSWSNPTTASLGTDEALGGALLTPIPWLARRSPEESNGESADGSGNGGGAQIHSEGSETIDGPNGMGRIETVSVSVNGIPSTGHARGVTQGELLRQEQRAGVVPVNQLSRNHDTMAEDDKVRDRDMEGNEEGEEEEEIPHARGPEEIGVGDTGPQGVTTSYMGEDGVQMQDIDVEAAVGRKHEEDPETTGAATSTQATTRASAAKDDDAASDSSAESTGTKREAEQELEPETVKKIKEDAGDADGDIDVGAGEDASDKPEPKDDDAMSDELVEVAAEDKNIEKDLSASIAEPEKDADMKDGADSAVPEPTSTSTDQKMDDGAD